MSLSLPATLHASAQPRNRVHSRRNAVTIRATLLRVVPLALEDSFGHAVHPDAKALLTATSDVLDAADVGPLNSDAGHDAVGGFLAWREEDDGTRVSAYLDSILGDWGGRYAPKLLLDSTLQAQLADEAFDFGQDVYRLDETVLGVALAAMLFDGALDERAKTTARFAATRQRHPLVLGRIFPEAETRAARGRCVLEIERLLDAIPAKRKKRAGSAAKRKVSVEAPWPPDQVLATRLTSGQCVLLHYFRDAQGGTAFYVFDWKGTELPPRSALDALDIKPSKDLWKFHLSFPRVSAADAPAVAAEIARKLVAIGVPRKSARAASPCSIVQWEALEAYLNEAHDW